MAGSGKRVIVYIPEMQDPELMYKLFDQVVESRDDLVKCFWHDGEIKNKRSMDNPHKFGLSPWVGINPKVLILGTMAGDTSIKAQSYYDSPLNPFWKIMIDIFNPTPDELALSKKEFITSRGIALWDCIASGVRLNSSDSSFSERTLSGNDIQGFLDDHPTIHTIILNGTSTTVKYFKRFCNVTKPVQVVELPSTASMITYKNKVSAWNVLKKLLNE